MNFRVGQEVVCIDDDWKHPLTLFCLDDLPVKGGTYFIEGFCADGWLQLKGFMHSQMTFGRADISFHPESFRPLVRTDISVFTAMLAPAPKQKEVERV